MNEVIVQEIENIKIEIVTEQTNVEISENGVDVNVEISETVVEIAETTTEVNVKVEGIQGATGASNILGKSPNFTYNQDKTLAGMTYANAASKTFAYQNDRLKYVDSTLNGFTFRKEFFYNQDSSLNRIEEVQI